MSKSALEHILIERDTISWGSNSATARCRVMGMEGTFLLKCYFRHRRNAQAIYGDRFYPQEFGVAGFRGRMEYADIALLDWIEGTPLETLLWREDADYKAFSEAFDRLALRTLKRCCCSRPRHRNRYLRPYARHLHPKAGQGHRGSYQSTAGERARCR